LKKRRDVGCHLSEEILEEYAFGRTLEQELIRIEEHLLVCETCQELLTGLEEFILIFKAAAAPWPTPPLPIPIARGTDDRQRVYEKLRLNRSPWPRLRGADRAASGSHF
jgi:hypothetical protein